MAEVPTVSGEGAALFRKMFGDLLADLVGLAAGDWISAYRRIRQDKLAHDADQIMKARGASVDPERLQLPSVATIIASAQDESRPEIQDLWARLLAAALDPRRADQVRKEFLETVKRFEPLDALILKTVTEDFVYAGNSVQQLADLLKQKVDRVEISLNHLWELGCIEGQRNGHGKFTPFNNLGTTAFGRELIRVLYD